MMVRQERCSCLIFLVGSWEARERQRPQKL